MSAAKPSYSLLFYLSEIHKHSLLILFVLGNLGHVISTIILAKKSWRKKVCVFYFHLFIFYNLIYINTRILSSVLRTYFDITLQNQNLVLCKLYSYLTNLFTLLPPTVLALASIDRLLISSHDMDTRLYSSKRLAYFSLSIGTAFWSLFFLHALINHKLQQFAPFLPPMCFYEFTDSLIEFFSYSTVTINVFVSLTMIILIILALINVRRNRHRTQRHPISRKDIQLLHCLFIHDVVYALLSLPIHVYYVIITIVRDYQPTSVDASVKGVTYNYLYLAYHIPYACSFFIFILVSKSLRLEVKRLILKLFCLSHLETQEERTNGTRPSPVLASTIVVHEKSCQNRSH